MIYTVRKFISSRSIPTSTDIDLQVVTGPPQEGYRYAQTYVPIEIIYNGSFIVKGMINDAYTESELIHIEYNREHPNLGDIFNLSAGNPSGNTDLNILVDYLYNKANPRKALRRDGTPYKWALKELHRRLKAYVGYEKPQTIKLYQEMEPYILRRIQEYKDLYMFSRDDVPLTYDQAYEAAVEAVNEISPRLSVSYFTTEPSISPLQILKIGTTYRRLSEGLDPRDYGYFYNSAIETYLLENQIIHNNRLYTITDGDTRFTTCSSCEDWCLTEEMEDGDGICDRCSNNLYKIHNYTTRVPALLSFKAKNVTPNTLYLGVELEFETSNKEQARRKVGKALKGHAIMKSDGSISHGFEVVTCPATIDIHLDVFKPFYESIPEELGISDSVGMHVHVSRKPLSALTQGKLIAFMNHQDNLTFIAKMAGRSLNSYCRQDLGRTITFLRSRKSRGASRSTALNTNNSDTIEFRIFSTPLTFKEFSQKLQFVSALVDYCKPCSTPLSLKESSKHSSFISWVLSKARQYPDLSSLLKGNS